MVRGGMVQGAQTLLEQKEGEEVEDPDIAAVIMR